MMEDAPQPKPDPVKYTIPSNNLTIQAGEHVLVKPKSDKELPYVGKLFCIRVDPQKPNAKVIIRWFYRPEDTPQKRRLFHGLKELFRTSHLSGELPAECINGKIRIHSFEDYQKLKLVGEEDYFWRFDYDWGAKNFQEGRVEVFCLCAMPQNPDLRMILCEGCGEWFHLYCLGMSLQESERIPHYYCQSCNRPSIMNPPVEGPMSAPSEEMQ